MTTTRTAAPVFTPELRPYIKESSADAAQLRAMLASAGVSTDGRTLTDAVRAFQLRHNAGGGAPLEVDGKAGEQTLRALRGRLGGETRDCFAELPGPAYPRARAPEGVSGVKLGTAIQASGRNDAAARHILEAQLPRAKASPDGPAPELVPGATVAAARKALPSADPVPFTPPVGTNAFEAAIEQATRSGRNQLLELNGARVIVQPGDTMDAVRGRYQTSQRYGGVPGVKPDLGVARALGKVAVPVGLALDALDIGAAVKRDADRADGAHTEATRAVGRAAGGWGGAAAGAAAGAAVGSVVPVVGTAIGAVVGGVAGGLGGSELGELIADAIR